MVDVDAWRVHRSHRWVYYKPLLCELQGLDWGPCPVLPARYPVVVRPMTNLCGMGVGVQVVESESAYLRVCKAGYFWTGYLDGDHLSIDVKVEDGKVVGDACVWLGKALEGYPGAFEYWTLLEEADRYVSAIESVELVARCLFGYSGSLNVECIGGFAIEAHLREGDVDLARQWGFPLYLCPVWEDTCDARRDLDVEAVRGQDGVVEVIVDDPPEPGCGLRRRMLVVTRRLL